MDEAETQSRFLRAAGRGKSAVMHLPTVVRLLPTDPGYMPFGLPALRGLNALTIGVVATVGLLLGLFNTFHALGSISEAPPRFSDNEFGAWAWDLAKLSTWGVVRGPVRVVIAFMPMVLLVTMADNLTTGGRPPRRIALLTAGMLVGALIQAWLAYPVACLVDYEYEDSECAFALAPSWGKLFVFVRGVIWGSLFAALLFTYKRERDTTVALHNAQLQRLQAERQETAARLASLQSQIEPHFLFNTLAIVQRLYEVQPDQGRVMLRNLVEYMKSALPQMRRNRSTLGREIALARAYLNVQELRMGHRLRVEVEVRHELLRAALPALMLVTLVENAIKHGLSPKPSGGTVRVSATAADGRLTVEVEDDGVGLRIGAGTGRGLANTRGRLAAQFGRAGDLTVDSRTGGGVVAALRLPLTIVEAEAATV